MNRRIDICQTPADAVLDRIHDRIAVCIDVLRATTTMTAALAAGATAIVAFDSIDEARAAAARNGWLTGGERNGLPIKGFDLGNSPGDYRPDNVAGRMIAMTTTNGTRAIAACQSAGELLIGAMVNAAAVARHIANDSRDIVLVCAGTGGLPTLEDQLCGGLIVDRLIGGDGGFGGPGAKGTPRWQAGIAALASREMWRAAGRQIESGSTTLFDLFCQCQGGENLLAIGLENDIRFAAQLDTFDFVPRLDRQSGRIIR